MLGLEKRFTNVQMKNRKTSDNSAKPPSALGLRSKVGPSETEKVYSSHLKATLRTVIYFQDSRFWVTFPGKTSTNICSLWIGYQQYTKKLFYPSLAQRTSTFIYIILKSWGGSGRCIPKRHHSGPSWWYIIDISLHDPQATPQQSLLCLQFI